MATHDAPRSVGDRTDQPEMFTYRAFSTPICSGPMARSSDA
jgi:hypothetical protein